MTHISKTALRTPDKPAVIMAPSGEVVSYKQLDDVSNQVAHLLRKLGLVSGDHICLMMENCREFFEVYMGAMRCGVIVTPVNASLKLDECRYIIENSRSKMLVCTDKCRALGRDLASAMPEVQHFYCARGGCEQLGDWSGECATQPTTPIPDQSRGWVMMYSSGTTGHPKGILTMPDDLGVEDLHPNLQRMADAFGYDEDTVYLSPGPLYHTAPILSCEMALNQAATIVVMEKFDALQALQAIERYKVTHSQWVPIMFIRLLKLPESDRNGYDLSSLRIAIHNAAPCPVEVKEAMINWWGEVIYEIYSGTEGAGTTMIDSKEWMAHKGSVGRSADGAIHVLDEDGNELSANEIGEIYFDGGAKFEYFGEAEKTRDPYNNSGWATMGDVGYIDEDGYLYLTDRKNFMIISGGVNIYPQEIENCLILHEQVSDVAVFGVPHEEFGEQVCAVVEPAKGVTAGDALAEELIAWTRSRISNVKTPRQLHFVDQLPRLENGKLYKRWLVEKYS